LKSLIPSLVLKNKIINLGNSKLPPPPPQQKQKEKEKEARKHDIVKKSRQATGRHEIRNKQLLIL